MNWLESRIFRVISTIVLSVFIWNFCLFQAAYAFKDSNKLRVTSDEQRTIKAKRPEGKLQKAINDIVQIVQTVQTVQTVEEKNVEKNKLKGKKAEIEAIDVEIRQQFQETEKKLKDAGLPLEILQRHRDFVSKYEENLNELKANLDAIERHRVESLEFDEAVENTKTFLEKVKPPKKHIPLDPNKLPHRSPEVKKPELIERQNNKKEFKLPRIKDSNQQSAFSNQGIQDSSQEKTNSELSTVDREPVLVASNGSLSGLLNSPTPILLAQASDFPAPVLLALADTSTSSVHAPPTDADLSETIEVQFTPEITAKALELENNTVKIYNWVRNNIEFVPTYGSIQGADMCLQTKLCNAFDTASLLIALLRTSGIHARYVEGTVEIPIEKVKNWVGGFTDSMAALNLMASGGIPVTGGLTSGGEIFAARIEHVWVEAYVDYIPYRGAVTGPGDTWIPLDASFKQYNYIEGIDADTAVPTDFNALITEVQSQSTIDSTIPSITGLPTATIQNQVSDFKTRLDEYLATNFPQVTDYYELDKTLHGYKEIIQKDLRFLPNTLAGMKIITKLDTFSELPDTLRHKINFKLNDTGLLGNMSFTYTAFLPEITGKRITLSYIPATPEDAQVMSDADGILNFPLYLVEVIPELKIEGQTVATGNKVTMGLDQTFERYFYRPNGSTGHAVNNVYAGEYYAIGLNANKVNFQYLYNRTNIWQPDTAVERDDRLGELLYLTSMFYFAWSDFFADKLAKSSDIISLRHPSECLVGMRFNASYVFGTPVSISSVGLNMDVDRDVISVVSKTNNSNTKLWFMIQTGLFGSSLEHSLFKTIMGFDAVSAVKFLDLASQQNLPIYIIDSENSYRVDELQISFEDKQDIRNLINAGRLVLVPQSNIQYFEYTGIGYVAIDMQTGDGAYIISGGLNGGDTACDTVTDCTIELVKLANELLGDYEDYGAGYKDSITYIIESYPDIADDPDVKFVEWAKRVLFVGEIAKEIPWESVRVIIGQQILYNTMIMLKELTIPF